MALNDDAVFSVGTGRFYTAAVGTAAPTDLLAPGAGWSEVGHTSLEDIISITSDGGDATTLGTLQNKTLRTTYAPRVETLAITLQQWDAPALKLYYGANADEIAADSPFLGVPQNPTPTQVAFLAVLRDGDNVFAFYAPKAEVFRGDDLDISDTESLAGLPLSVKPLQNGANDWAYAVTPLGAA